MIYALGMMETCSEILSRYVAFFKPCFSCNSLINQRILVDKEKAGEAAEAIANGYMPFFGVPGFRYSVRLASGAQQR